MLRDQKELEFFLRLITFFAIDWSAFLWSKGHFALLTTFGTGCLMHFARSHISESPAAVKVSHVLFLPFILLTPKTRKKPLF